jgi:hypothetical protein
MEYESIVLTGILGTSLFWVIRTIRKDKQDKFNKNDTTVAFSED